MNDETQPQGSDPSPEMENAPEAPGAGAAATDGEKDSGIADTSAKAEEIANPVTEPTESVPETTAAESSESATEPLVAEKAAAAAAKRKVAEQKAKQTRVAPLYRAFRGRRSINGRVEKAIKGGYEVRIGKARAFCPHSQIDVRRVEDPEAFVGSTQVFRITQLRRGGDDVIVSRRAVIEEDRREEAKAVRATLIEGSVMLGRVTGLAKFGAFVDLGAGVTGLVHLSELSHGRVQRADQAAKIGEAVRVKILKLQDGQDRISLSIRQASEDPWVSVPESFQAGQVVSGKVLRLADFGAFVELTPGVEALAPASEFPPNTGGWREGLAQGSEQRWQVLRVDAAQRRISLTPAGDENAAEIPELAPGVELRGRVQRIERFGVFVWLAPGRIGLMPNVLTGTPPGTDLARSFPIADEVEVEVVSLDDSGKIRLAKKGADKQRGRPRGSGARPDRPPRRAPKAERLPDVPMSDSNEGFGSLLADKLKDALG